MYTYLVTNPGDVPLNAGTVTDAAAGQGSCAPVTFVSGDTTNVGQLDPGETWTYTCAKTLTETQPVINTATASGLPVIAGRPGRRFRIPGSRTRRCRGLHVQCRTLS